MKRPAGVSGRRGRPRPSPGGGVPMYETNSKFTRKQRRHLAIAFAAVTIATICIVFGNG